MDSQTVVINCIHISLIFGVFLYKFLIKSENVLVFYLTLGGSFSTTTGSISKNLGIPNITSEELSIELGLADLLHQILFRSD